MLPVLPVLPDNGTFHGRSHIGSDQMFFGVRDQGNHEGNPRSCTDGNNSKQLKFQDANGVILPDLLRDRGHRMGGI